MCFRSQSWILLKRVGFILPDLEGRNVRKDIRITVTANFRTFGQFLNDEAIIVKRAIMVAEERDVEKEEERRKKRIWVCLICK